MGQDSARENSWRRERGRGRENRADRGQGASLAAGRGLLGRLPVAGRRAAAGGEVCPGRPTPLGAGSGCPPSEHKPGAHAGPGRAVGSASAPSKSLPELQADYAGAWLPDASHLPVTPPRPLCMRLLPPGAFLLLPIRGLTTFCFLFFFFFWVN